MYAVKKYFGRLKSDMVPAASLISAFYAGVIFAHAYAHFCYQLRTSEFFEQMSAFFDRTELSTISVKHAYISDLHVRMCNVCVLRLQLHA